MRRALSKKGRSQRGWRGSTVEPPGDGRTVRSGSFSCTRVPKGPPSLIERSICRKSGRRIGCVAARQAFPRRWSLRGIGELAKLMLARAFAAGVPAEWVVGDTVYGYDEMRGWLEEQERNYVLAVPETHTVWIAGQSQPVGLVAALLPPDAWTVLSAGEGSQGPRLYEWAWLSLSMGQAGEARGRGSWLLIRRSLSDPSKRAYYRVSAPVATTLEEAVRVAGRRWSVEEGLEEAKGEVGLDQYEVRGFRAWYRHITLALLAHAVLVIMRAQEKKREATTRAPD